MMYRKLDKNGDYTFGKRNGNFYVDSPDAAAQAVKTRLLLFEGEWFIDLKAGLPYNPEVLGAGTVKTYDAAIQAEILNTQGITETGIRNVVTRIIDYASSVDPTTRRAKVSCKIDTIFGQTTLETTL